MNNYAMIVTFRALVSDSMEIWTRNAMYKLI